MKSCLLLFMMMSSLLIWGEGVESYSCGDTVQATGYANYRNSPSLSGGIIFQTTPGQLFTISSSLGCNSVSADGYNWLPLTNSLGYPDGWSADSFFSFYSSGGSTNPNPNPSPTPSVYPTGSCLAAGSGGANFRNGPSISAGIYYQASPGTQFTVTGGTTAADGYNWIPVRDSSSTNGYLADSVVSSCSSSGGGSSGGGSSGSGVCNYPTFKQCNPAWSGNYLGTSSWTICSYGCLITAMASAITLYPGQSYIDPGSFNSWAYNNGGFYDLANGWISSAAPNAFGMQSLVWATTAGSVSPDQIKAAVDNCQPVIVHTWASPYNQYGHWLLITSSNGYPNSFTVMDPGGFDLSSLAYSAMDQYAIYSKIPGT